MHKKEQIDYWKDKIPNLSSAMISENIEEAVRVVRDFRTCDDFVFMNYQFYGNGQGDNSIDLAGYWNECYDFIKHHAPHLLPKKHGF